MYNQKIKVGVKLVLKSIIISSFISSSFLTYAQDTTKLRKEISRVLKKNGLENAGYELKVISTNQKGGQTAFVINNHYNYLHEEEPVILIDTNGIKLINTQGQNKTYRIHFRSSDAGSTNFKIDCYLVTPINKERQEALKLNVFTEDLQIPKNGSWEIEFTNLVEPYPAELFIVLMGSYSNLSKSKNYSVNNVYLFEMRPGKVHTLIGEERNSILRKVKEIQPKSAVITR